MGFRDKDYSFHNFGSTFYEVYCMVCNTVLGKTYVASPPDLDHIRGAFTLAAETLNSYEVGSSDVSLSMNADVTNKALDERLQKLQYVVCILEERIKKLEGVVCPHDNPSTSDYNHVPDQNIKLQDRESVTSSESALCSDIGLRQPLSGMVEHHDDHGSVVTRQNDGSDQSVPLEYLLDGNRRLKRKRAR
ncbi:hypothetical protein MAR_019258 [Mya arenaria]|uniref:Mis18 domain-containing protein n=1 Tax=Mya arenaria TaxID=6604 RepID=A0ABY7EHF0_MYAAR|nr:hypothetical protein MAR_019258 [Mya arenaria]